MAKFPPIDAYHRLDALRAALAAYTMQYQREDLEPALECLDEVAARIRVEGGDRNPVPRVFTRVEGRPGPETLHPGSPPTLAEIKSALQGLVNQL